MSRKSQPNGFTAVAVIIVIAVIVAIGLTGWFVWHKNKDDVLANKTNTNSTTQTNKTNTDTSPQQGQNTTQTDPSGGGKYLVIKEWSVRVLLPSSLKGNVFYALREYDDTDGLHYEAADVNSKLFQPECRDTAADLGLDVIRTSSTPANTTGSTHVGSFWYGVIYGKDGCGKFLSGTKASIASQLQNSIRTVEAIN